LCSFSFCCSASPCLFETVWFVAFLEGRFGDDCGIAPRKS
jgi:hypothetical protein